jgi:DNA polymerase I-like protein with 3'-5' exonuclease and polymerase domains
MNDGELDLSRCFPIILVHDSIVCECEADYASTAQDIVRSSMESSPRVSLEWTDIPFNADVQVGHTWGDVE